MLKRLRWIRDRILARLLRDRVHLSRILVKGDLAVYLMRIRGVRTEEDPVNLFLLGEMPHPPEHVEWFAKLYMSWWHRGITDLEFTYRGPARHPCTVTWRPPRWALPEMARLLREALQRDQWPQASYEERGPYR